MEKINVLLKDNEKIIKELMHHPLSSDAQIRSFKMSVNNQKYDALLCFYDGLVDSELINNFILKQLMKNYDVQIPHESVIKNKNKPDLKSIVTTSILSDSQVSTVNNFEDAINKILHGDVALFVDTIGCAIICDVKKVPNRSVDKAENEMNIKGPSEAFIENYRTNTALIRKYVKDNNLIFENYEIGIESKTRCAICYISTITNDSLIAEVKKRISSIKVDYLIDSGELEQLIEDKTYLVNPVVLSTERPDKVASNLTEGRVAIVVEGSSNVLIVPAIFTDFLNASEDSYIRHPYTLLVKAFRIPAILLAIFLPGLYIAICNFHQEMIPTDLLFAIARHTRKSPLLDAYRASYNGNFI